MNISRIMIFSGTLLSLSLTASTGQDLFVDCFRSCNEAFITDSLENGGHDAEDDEFGRYMLEGMLQEKLANTSNTCSEQEFTLMGEALCYFASHGICAFRYEPKPIYMPPFSSNLENAPSELLELINKRALTAECSEAFHGRILR